MSSLHHALRPSLPLALALLLTACDDGAPATQAARPEPSAPAAAPAPARTPEAGDRPVFAEALAHPDPYARVGALAALIPTLGPEGLPEAQDRLGDFRFELGSAEFELLLRYWSDFEPEAAARWVFAEAPPLYRNTAARTAVESWARQETAAAVEALDLAIRWRDEDLLRLAQLALVTGWFDSGDREGLLQYIEDLGSGQDRQRALYGWALALGNSEGSSAVIEWAESVPEDDRRFKLEVFRQTISALAWSDPPAATRFCDRHCDGPWAKGLHSVLVRTRLNRGDYGGDIVEWMGSVPVETEEQRENRDHTLWVAYALWGARKPAEALEWMDRQIEERGDADWVRRLRGEYARLLAADSPERAIEWAGRIEDESDRRRTLVRIANYWRRVDVEAADAWIEQSPLDERERERARDASKPHFLPRIPSRLGGARRGVDVEAAQQAS